jgi:hypothetical protein
MTNLHFPIELVDVVWVRPLGGYVLLIRFSDGYEGERDFSPMVDDVGPMVEPLRDPSFFAKVFIDDGVLAWPNGFDLDSIALHDEMRAAGMLRKSAA